MTADKGQTLRGCSGYAPDPMAGGSDCRKCGWPQEDHADKGQTPIRLAAGEEREWLIRKGGYYYRPNRAGYTTDLRDAGLYTQTEAEKEARIEPWHMFALHRDEVPGAKPIAAEVTIATLTAQLAAAEARVAVAAEALERIASHDNHGLTDGSFPSRVCLDWMVRTSEDAIKNLNRGTDNAD